MSSGRVAESAPRGAFPTAVRTAETISAFMSFCLQLRIPAVVAVYEDVNELAGEALFPSLEKEGWTRPQEEYRAATFLGADGVVGSNYR